MGKILRLTITPTFFTNILILFLVLLLEQTFTVWVWNFPNNLMFKALISQIQLEKYVLFVLKKKKHNKT